MKKNTVKTALIFLIIIISSYLTAGQVVAPEYGNVIIARNTNTDSTLEISAEPNYFELALEIDKYFGGFSSKTIHIKNPNNSSVRVELSSASDSIYFPQNNLTLDTQAEKDITFYIYADKETKTVNTESFSIIFYQGENSISKSTTVKYSAKQSKTEALKPADMNISANAGDTWSTSLVLQNPYEESIEILISNPAQEIIKLPAELTLSPNEIKQVQMSIDTSKSLKKEINAEIIYNLPGRTKIVPLKINVSIKGRLPIIWVVIIAVLLLFSLLVFTKRKRKLDTPAERILDEI